jgi:hypothetical protein
MWKSACLTPAQAVPGFVALSHENPKIALPQTAKCGFFHAQPHHFATPVQSGAAAVRKWTASLDTLHKVIRVIDEHSARAKEEAETANV